MFKKPKINKLNKFTSLSTEVTIESNSMESLLSQNNDINDEMDKTKLNEITINHHNQNKIENVQKNNNKILEKNVCKIEQFTTYDKDKQNFVKILELNESNETFSSYDKLLKLKAEIDKKNEKTKRRGIQIKPLESVKTGLLKEDKSDIGIKKIFISENELTNTKDPEEYKKLVGVKKEEIDSQKESKRRKILEHHKDLFTLPLDLQVTPQTKNDYVENLIRLSAAGLIEVPLSLENKLKNIEETEVMKKQIIDKRLAEELDYLKVLKKLGPSYAKGYKNDLSHKKLTKLNNVFENVFVNLNGRKRKLLKEKMILDNRILEYSYINDIKKIPSSQQKKPKEKDYNFEMITDK